MRYRAGTMLQEAVREGAAADIAAAYRDHAETVRRTAYAVVRDRALAEDVTQDVFLALWVRPDRFDSSRGTFESLLRVMARSRALDAARRNSASLRAVERLAGQADRAGTPPDPAEAVVSAASGRAVRVAVRALPDEQREAISLTYWGGLTSEQVASHRRVPLGTAKSRIRIGLTKLRRDFED